MDAEQFFAASRLVIVAGKGGVGKTVVSAALARAAARCGNTTLLIEVEGKSGLSAMFGRAEVLDYDERVLAEGDDALGVADVLARTITPDKALVDYLNDHGLSRISKRLVRTGALDVVSTAVPGIRDILVLGKVKQIERRADLGLVVLDAPAAGHAITFLQSARSLLDSIGVGPINTQAKDVLRLLTDNERCQVILVTLAEETPVNELIDTAFALEDRVGIHLGPVVVNGLTPDLPDPSDPLKAAAIARVALAPEDADRLARAIDFRRRRVELQQSQIERLEAQLPLPQLHLPYVFDSELELASVDGLADQLLTQLAAR